MKLKDLFKSKSAKQVDILFMRMKEGLNRNTLPDAIRDVTPAVAEALVARVKNGTQDERKQAAIIKMLVDTLKGTMEGGDPTFSMKKILSFRTVDADRNVFVLSTNAAMMIAGQRNDEGGFYSVKQVDAVAWLAKTYAEYAHAVGSGSAGIANEEQALTHYLIAAEAYAGFGEKEKAVKQADAAQYCAARNGHRLSEKSQEVVVRIKGLTP